jgi:hypothetical protein
MIPKPAEALNLGRRAERDTVKKLTIYVYEVLYIGHNENKVEKAMLAKAVVNLVA